MAALAERPGLGERQSASAFFANTSAPSPDAVVLRTRNLAELLAKQLIHENALARMAEIACVCGHWQRAPSQRGDLRLQPERAPGELRRLGGEDIAVQNNGELSLLLRYQPPYDWPAMLEFLRQRAIPGLESVADGCYSRALSLDGAHGSLSVQPGEKNALCAGIRISKLRPLRAEHHRALAACSTGCRSAGLSAAHSAKGDPESWRSLVVKRSGPGARPGVWDGFRAGDPRRALANRSSSPRWCAWPHGLWLVYGEIIEVIVPVGALTHVFPARRSAGWHSYG